MCSGCSKPISGCATSATWGGGGTRLAAGQRREAYAAIRAFYGTPALWHKLAVIERLTEFALNTIGGVRRKGEILVLAAGDQVEGFQKRGRRLLAELLRLG